MICDYCKTDFKARRGGRPQHFCPGGDCRRAFEREARKAGARVLRATGEKKARKPRTNYRMKERELWGLGLL